MASAAVFLRRWNGSGFAGGIWTYQNTSSNFPWNTLSARATILAH